MPPHLVHRIGQLAYDVNTVEDNFPIRRGQRCFRDRDKSRPHVHRHRLNTALFSVAEPCIKAGQRLLSPRFLDMTHVARVRFAGPGHVTEAALEGLLVHAQISHRQRASVFNPRSTARRLMPYASSQLSPSRE